MAGNGFVIEGLRNYSHLGPIAFDTSLDRALTGLTNLQTIVAQCTTPVEQAQLAPLFNDFNRQLYGVATGTLSQQSAQALLQNAQGITKKVENVLQLTKVLNDGFPYPEAPSSELRQQTQRTTVLLNEFRDAKESLIRGLYYIENSLGTLSKDVSLDESVGKNISLPILVQLGEGVGKDIMALLPKVAGVTPVIGMFHDQLNVMYYHDIGLKKADPLVADKLLTAAAAEAYGVAFAKSTLMYQMSGQIDPTMGGDVISDWASEYHVAPEALDKLGHGFLADRIRSQSFAPEV